MSSIKIGFAAIGSLIALTAQASAEVRYNKGGITLAASDFASHRH